MSDDGTKEQYRSAWIHWLSESTDEEEIEDEAFAVSVNAGGSYGAVAFHGGFKAGKATCEQKLVEDLEWAISKVNNELFDHACAQCIPNGPMTGDGFVCRYHRIINAIAKIKGES